MSGFDLVIFARRIGFNERPVIALKERFAESSNLKRRRNPLFGTCNQLLSLIKNRSLSTKVSKFN